jgi:hypothetical protein
VVQRDTTYESTRSGSPLFEPFLEWLYQQDLTRFEDLPSHVDLPEAEFQLHGYRRPGE